MRLPTEGSTNYARNLFKTNRSHAMRASSRRTPSDTFFKTFKGVITAVYPHRAVALLSACSHWLLSSVCVILPSTMSKNSLISAVDVTKNSLRLCTRTPRKKMCMAFSKHLPRIGRQIETNIRITLSSPTWHLTHGRVVLAEKAQARLQFARL